MISTKIRTALLVEPGHSVFSSVQLTTGELKKILHAHPQASLDIEFTLYLDPVTTADGRIANRLTNIKPIKVLIKRPCIELTGKYLRNRFESITKGQSGQKIKTAHLFTGLLMEQQEMASGKVLYRCLYADWMPTMLRSTLIHQSGLLRNPSDKDWMVKVHTMADMLYFPLDRELTSAISENLNNSKWPVRIMTLYLLAKSPGSQFDQVLDWAAKYDSNEHVRNMVNALIAAKARGPKPAEPELPGEPAVQLPIRQQ